MVTDVCRGTALRRLVADVTTLITHLTKFCPSLDSYVIGLLPHVTVVLHLRRHLTHVPLPPMNHTWHTADPLIAFYQ
ncbi:hypothetical protein E2C01_036939 [Portunus trituberculatus]|uniref:Uncharacterized protein n=1 Tax=Portunus trituberculatus TaxID=210409 RepID=A0A5B7FCS1_PORTR|nr:hypothetical protein [Portunus trituberculatus]